MKVDCTLDSDPHAAARSAREAQDAGCDAVWVGETNHDAFLAMAFAAAATDHISIGTGVAIALARTPMTVALAAHDLQRASDGRFLLGLGSQVKAHIERRFSMPWSEPAPRMREFVLAVRAIWASWQEQAPLDFRGDYYTHTLMSPVFDPGPNSHASPPIHLAGVGELMTSVAAEVADGFVCHPFTTVRYLEEVTRPVLARTRAAAGRDLTGFEISGTVVVVTGRDDSELAGARSSAARQVAFYASTPAYRPVLQLGGWDDLQDELLPLSKAGRWDEMTALVDGDVLEAFTVVAEPDAAAAALIDRFSGRLDRIRLIFADGTSPSLADEVRADVLMRARSTTVSATSGSVA